MLVTCQGRLYPDDKEPEHDRKRLVPHAEGKRGSSTRETPAGLALDQLMVIADMMPNTRELTERLHQA